MNFKLYKQLQFTTQQAMDGAEVQLYYFFTPRARWGDQSTTHHDRFSPEKYTGPFWTDTENIVPTRIRSLDRPARD
jgi:hypothetical protein